MLNRILNAVGLLALGSGLLAAGDLEKNFVNPPDSAKPGVYWYFMNGNLNGKEMTADLESMKAAQAERLKAIGADFRAFSGT